MYLWGTSPASPDFFSPWAYAFLSNEKTLVGTLKGCKGQGFPPFASVIQGAMQLKDSAENQATLNANPTFFFAHDGVNSLAAMEFRNYVGHDMGADVAVLDIMGNRNIEALSAEIVRRSKFCARSREGDE